MMAEHLVVTLSAALASFGDLAGHERRGGLNWPGRSALLGLASAALGVRRDDAQGLKRLDALKTAVAVYGQGEPLRDYHTVQTIPSAAAKRPDSRRAAFAEAGRRRVNTAITLRDYRVGALYAACYWGEDALLQQLEQAFRAPGFVLYLGRKSCPLNAPLAPRRIEAASAGEALARHTPPGVFWPVGRRDGSGLACWIPRPSHLVMDPSDAVKEDILWTETRHDQPLDRGVWHFTARDSAIVKGRER